MLSQPKGHRKNKKGTHLSNLSRRIRLLQSLPQRTSINLQPSPQPLALLQIPLHPSPNPFPPPLHPPIRLLGKQPDQIKVSHHLRPRRVQHLVLFVVIPLPQLLFLASTRLLRLQEHGPVEINRDPRGVVDGPDEVIDAGGGGQQGRNQRTVLGPANPFAFEADEDVDLRGIFGLETLGFGEVGSVVRDEVSEGCFAIVRVELYGL